MLRPYDNRILFFDAEFSSLRFEESALLSFGAVTMDGATYYCEIAYDGPVSDFVRDNVLPSLTGPKITLAQARTEIAAFIRAHYGDAVPFLMTYVYKYDAFHWYKLFGHDDDLSHRIILDFASMLFACGIDPEAHSASRRDDFLRALGVDPASFAKHDALADAQALRAAYRAFIARGKSHGDESC